MNGCDLYLGEKQIGRATWRQVGDRCLLQAECPCEPGWIYRLVLKTEQGEQRLGVMLPKGERFVLCREMAAGQVPLTAYVDRTLPGETHLPGLPLALSAFQPDKEEAFCGAELTSAVWMEVKYLLYPLSIGQACAYASCFCLTSVLTDNEQTYGVFCKKDGQYLPLSDKFFSEALL